MARFGEFKAQFFAPDDLDTPLADSSAVNYRVPISGITNAVMNADGRTEVLFGYDDKLSQLAVEGNVVVIYQYDSLNETYVGGVPFCLPFTIESVTPAGPGLLRVEGPDLLAETKNVQVFRPIGAGTTTNTTVAVAVDDPAFFTVAVGAPINNDSVSMNSSTGWEEGDEARIELDGSSGYHVVAVTAVDPPAAPNPYTIVFAYQRMPGQASIGNDIERRRRRVQVASGQGAAFAVGVECRLTLDNGSTHTTIIAEEPEDDVITMRDGAPDSAAVGKAIQATDYSQPTTADVNTILSLLPGWSAEYENGAYTGTAAGTHHAPYGESVYDLLTATAKRTGEFFRLKDPGVSVAPERKVVWRRTYDYAGSGGNLRLVQPAQADIDNEALNVNRGIITGDVEREGVYLPVTRVIPFAGDKRISLKLCSEAARLQALVEGLTLVDTGLGLYTPPYLKNATAEATSLGVISRAVTFSNVRPETDHSREWQSVADQLMRSAIAYLYEHGTGVRYKYTVPDVVCAVPVYPGQRVEMVYTASDGRWSVNRTGANALYVLEVRARFSPPEEDEDGNLNDRGKLMTLVLVESPWDIPDLEGVTAAAVAEVGRIGRQGTGGTGGTATTTVVTGGTAVDHGALTGLADDDHPHYVRADGTRAMTGSLALGDGLTVDGVDVSAHAANASAHHAPVTAANSGISLSGQAVGAALASPSILEISSGLRAAAASAGNGIILNNQVYDVDLATDSGLLFASTKLALGTPSAVSATSVGAVSGNSHTHPVTASSAPGPATALLKTDTDGKLSVYRMGVGTAADNAAGLKVSSPSTTQYGLYLKQLSGQTAAMARFEKADGTALLILTNSGDLESGSPGFVSGHTGWQIAADGSAEFNNVRVRGELHATTFVADEMHATGGTLVVATATTVAEMHPSFPSYNNTLGAIDGASATKIVVNNSWATGANYFTAGDVVRIKPMGETAGGGSLTLPDIYLQVISTVGLADRNLAQGNPGRSVLLCTRRSGGSAGFVVPSGSAAVKWTRVGQSAGTYKGALLLTSDLSQSPYLDVFTVAADVSSANPWPGSGETRTPPTVKPRVRVGNLDGVLGLAEQWGIAAGTDLSDTSTAAKYFVASDLGLTLQNIDASIYSGSDRIIRLSTAGMEFRVSQDTFINARSLNWKTAAGATVGALSVRRSGDGLFDYMELGLRPTFGSVLAPAGVRIYDNFTGDTQIDLVADSVTASNLAASGALSAGGVFQANGVARMGSGLSVGNTVDTPATGIIQATSAIRTDGGIVLGSRTANVGQQGAVAFLQRTTDPASSASYAHLYVKTVSGVQKLYVRFATGTIRELATA